MFQRKKCIKRFNNQCLNFEKENENLVNKQSHIFSLHMKNLSIYWNSCGGGGGNSVSNRY